MCDTCDDSRFELIEKYKQKLLDATNIEDSPEEMAVIDNILFRFWQMGWLNLATDTISRRDAIALLEEAESARLRGDILLFYPVMLNGLKKLPSAQPVAKDINVPTKDCISRATAIETVRKAKSIGQAHRMLVQLPSAQPDYQEVLGWLLAYHTKSFDLHGRYLPHEVISWLINDFTKEFIADRNEEE